MIDAGESADAVRPSTWVVVRVAALVVLGVSAGIVPLLAVPAAFLVWIGWLSLPSGPLRFRRAAAVALGAAGVVAAVGLVRFVVEYAMAGIVGGGQTATSRRAVSRLREIVFAQDMMRKNAFIDPDGDGVGSAGWLAELSGELPLRGTTRLDIPVLNRTWRGHVETAAGPAVEAGGYLFLVCLPSPKGWTARPNEPVDEEAAERRFVAYAWPSARRPGFDSLYSVDQHERILVGRAAEGELPHVGAAGAPQCDTALVESSSVVWRVWENKPPRARLPGDGQ